MEKLSVDQQIAAFLAAGQTCSLATVDEHYRPHAANVQYASDPAWRLYWVSKPEAEHSRHLDAQPQIAVTIYAHVDRPDQIHGVQLHGTAGPIIAGDREAALALYQQKYPFTTQPPYAGAVVTQQFYRFTPTWLRWIDNRERFGFTVEKNLID